MKLLKVEDSSSVIGMAHDEKLLRMYIEFKKTGVYVYYGVTAKEFEEVFLAQSRGTKLKEIVKGKDYKKLPDTSTMSFD